MPVLKLYKDKNIDCEKDLVLIEDYLIKIMNTELNMKWLNWGPFVGRFKLENSAIKKLHEDDGVSFLLVTHSKEVASFADRSLELRDGRFVAEHGEGVDVEDLSKDRELIIDETGTVTLPPDLLVRLGGAGRYTVGNVASGYLSLQGDSVEAMGKMELAQVCPACKYDYLDRLYLVVHLDQHLKNLSCA